MRNQKTKGLDEDILAVLQTHVITLWKDHTVHRVEYFSIGDLARNRKPLITYRNDIGLGMPC